MSKNEKRSTQTRVKHEILGEYLKKWGFIISSGLRGMVQRQTDSDRPFKMRFVYVDCFAHTGQYAPEGDDATPAYGSPIIGIEALTQIRDFAESNAGFIPDTFVILIEENRSYYRELKETLYSKGYGNRIKETSDLLSLQTGDIALLNGDFHTYIDQLLAFTGRSFTWAFYLLDPYGPKGIPLKAVIPIISQQRNDVMINFPYMDLHRKSQSAVDRSPEQEKHNIYHDEMYGSEDWRKIAEKYYGDASDERKYKMESELVDHYQNTLHQQDNDLAIKTIRLRFPDMERTMFYLFLTTHDPTGAITLNEILDNALLREYELREEHKNVVKKAGQMSLFETMEDPGKPTAQDPDLDHVADSIYSKCANHIIHFREVLRRMSDEPYYLSDIRKAMTILKRKGLAKYAKLENKELIEFT